MKTSILTTLLFGFFMTGYAQVDTLSTEIFQKDGNLGVGTNDPKIKFHIKDRNSQLYFGYQQAYDGPYINMIGEVAGETPMLGLGLAQKEYNYNGKILAKTDWAYIYGNNYNKGIAIIPDLVLAPAGLYVNKYGFVGIGEDDPKFLLNLKSDISSGIERNFIKLKNTSEGNGAYTGIILETGELGGNSAIQSYGINYSASSPYDFGGFLNITNASNGIMYIANSTNAIHKFYTKGSEDILTERVRIDKEGNLGIGTKKPIAKLQVADGDIYISDIEKGIIMKSPDGNCWRGVLDNSGQLNFTAIDCPENNLVNTNQQLKSSESILVFPNPTDNNIKIDLGENYIKNSKYSIFNLSGQLKESGKIKSTVSTIDISGFSKGVYLLNINDKKGNAIISRKIVKE